MTKLAYPTNRPFVDSCSKKTAYKVNRNTKFYKTLVDFRLSELPIVELIFESYCYYTGKTINFKGSLSDLMNDYDAYEAARRLVQANDRFTDGPIKIYDWTDGNMITMFFNVGESSNDKFLIVLEKQ